MPIHSPVELPEDIQRRLTVYKAAGAVLLIAVWGSFELVADDQTPIFVYLNIAVHETGHVLFRPFGQLTMLLMGSGFEVLFPFLVGVAFLLVKKDLVTTSICFGWAASAPASASTYIADADDGRLGLLGATGPDAAGDWERILGAEFFDRVFLADRIAAIVRTAGPRHRRGDVGLRDRQSRAATREVRCCGRRTGRDPWLGTPSWSIA